MYNYLYDIYFRGDIQAMEKHGIHDMCIVSDTDILLVDYEDGRTIYYNSDGTEQSEIPATEF